MMITKSAFKKFDEAYPDLRYYPDHVRTKHFDGSRDIGMYFQALIDRVKKISFRRLYVLSEMKKAGVSTWYCPMDEIISYR